MNYKKQIITILILIMILLTSCGNKAPNASKSGKQARLTFNEIDKGKYEGVYILNKDKTFTPVIGDLPDFAGETEKADPARYVRFYDTKKLQVSSLVPVATPTSPLVAIYNSTDNMPKEWYLEKYKDKGYTLGTQISLTDDKNMILLSDGMLKGSSAEKALGRLEQSGKEFIIESISGSSKLPIDNVDTNINALLGLEKDKLYKLNFFTGTKYESVTMSADTRVFQSEKIIELKNGYKKTTKGYFIINLPLNLKNGYYYISDVGFFKYEG